MRAHDISHLIFGCSTDQKGELRVQLWTRYGVEIKLPFLEKVRYFFEVEALKLVLNFDAVKFSFAHRLEFSAMKVEVANRAKQMTRKWRYFDEDSFMNNTVDELRKKFNVEVF